jgi:hypothetical protein
MDAPTYSSLEAFLAHHRALRAASRRNADEQRIFTTMSSLIEQALDANERTALDSGADTGAERRHRERAQVKLRRALIQKGVLSG